jgi:two-component system, chemotaxis family, CheB/CheR fusion protein
VTKFFRDHEVWEGIKKRVIPTIIQNSKSGAVRAWVVACSTGEEAYTLAILFQEYKDLTKQDFEIKVS